MEKVEKYTPNELENRWYDYWIENNLFKSIPDQREAYTIVMPPPNVTGILHMGHMLNNTIQDVLIRRAKLEGKNVCWVPGTDHASIATEAKVVKWIKDEYNQTKEEIGRDQFLVYAWQWTEKYGGTILDQLKRLGCACDWDRTKFTLDKELSDAVVKTFIDLFDQGYIYKGTKMVNWDPQALTNISDEEVNYEERKGKLYFLKYKLKGENDYMTVATTRPETIFGDTAIAVNPKDKRYKNWIGKKVTIPLVGRDIEIISDSYVDPEFGTGCLKITPAHDFNDYEIGKRHDLEIRNILNADATLNENTADYNGLDRDVAREKIVNELQQKGWVEKIEEHIHKVGTSERTGSVIEPRLSSQWFVKMDEIVKPALAAVDNGDLQLHPKKHMNTYKHWLENIRDWNISRQLWWGHRIPAYYYGEEKKDYVVADSAEAALVKIKEKTGKELRLTDIVQDQDVLDTWFSSWLWPISVFDGINNPNNKDFTYYYPTADLVTGPDIIFFWVARMVIAGYTFTTKSPFKNVYFTGIVRDNLRRKMSKQLGNSPDPIELMEKYGADGVRVGLLLSTSAGNDLLFDESLCMQGRNFGNKIWNAYKLISGWEVEKIETPAYAKEAVDWFESKIAKSESLIVDHLSKYRISDALLEIYKLIWDDFCSWYLEIVKPLYGEPIDEKTFNRTVEFFDSLMRLLHPFMPFITEELWHKLKTRTSGSSIMETDLPIQNSINNDLLAKFDLSMQLISAIRSWRKENNYAQKESLQIFADKNTESEILWPVVKKMCNLSQVDFVKEHPSGNLVFRVDVFSFSAKNNTLNIAEELEKTGEEIKYLQGFLLSVEKKLSNNKFVENAPREVVETEKKKAADAQEKITILQERIKQLKNSRS